MLDLIWIKTIQNVVVFLLSLTAFCLSLKFYNDTINVVVPEAPKAT